jgi:hypothetical protein
MKIFIKNRVSLSYIIFVKSELEKLNIDFKYVNLEEVKLIILKIKQNFWTN